MKLGDSKPARIPVHTPATQDSAQPSGILVAFAVIAITASGMTVILYSLVLYLLTVLNGSH